MEAKREKREGKAERLRFKGRERDRMGEREESEEDVHYLSTSWRVNEIFSRGGGGERQILVVVGAHTDRQPERERAD